MILAAGSPDEQMPLGKPACIIFISFILCVHQTDLFLMSVGVNREQLNLNVEVNLCRTKYFYLLYWFCCSC